MIGNLRKNRLPGGPLVALILLGVAVASAVLLTTQYYYLAVVPPVGILFLLLLVDKPQLAFYIMLFMVPFNAWRGLGGAYESFTITKLLGIFLLVIVPFAYIFGSKKGTELRSKLWTPLIFFLLLSLVSMALSQFPDHVHGHMRKLIVAAITFGFAMHFATRENMNRIIPGIIIVSVILSGGFALFGFLSGSSAFATGVAPEARGMARATGGDTHPNVLAMVLMVAPAFLAHRLIYTRRIMLKFVYAAGFPIVVFALFFTFSRSGFLVLLAVAVMIALTYVKKVTPRILGPFIMMGAIALIVVLVATPASVWDRQMSLIKWGGGEDKSLNRRWSYVVVAWKQFQNRPLLGHGPGAFSELYGETSVSQGFISSGALGALQRAAHNTYLEALVGTGLPGLVLFVMMIVLAVKNYTYARKAYEAVGDEESASLMAAYRTALISLALFLALSSMMYHKYFWMLLGLSQGAALFAPKPADPAEEMAREARHTTNTDVPLPRKPLHA